MELKKTPQADLENKKMTFRQMGIAIALCLTIFAFEWKSYDAKIEQVALTAMEQVEEEDIPITRQQDVPPPPPPPPVQVQVLEIVADNEEVADIRIDAEADDKPVAEAPVYTESTQEEEKVEELEVFTVVEESPEFPGGDEGRLKFLKENIKYPELAKETGVQGTVFINFVVEPNGAISNIKVLRGIGGGCDEEAVRVVSMFPKWKAGKQRGKNVRVSFNLPIKFTLG